MIERRKRWGGLEAGGGGQEMVDGKRGKEFDARYEELRYERCGSDAHVHSFVHARQINEQ